MSKGYRLIGILKRKHGLSSFIDDGRLYHIQKGETRYTKSIPPLIIEEEEAPRLKPRSIISYLSVPLSGPLQKCLYKTTTHPPAGLANNPPMNR